MASISTAVFLLSLLLPAPRAVDVQAADGTLLKATYFSAGRPGPGVLLFHQSQRTRHSWDDLAARLAAAGINVLTVDSRAKGESGGTADSWSKWWFRDLDTDFEFLVSQPGVDRNVIGIGGAGNVGVESAVEAARRHSSEVKSLALISGETEPLQSQFLHENGRLPALFVFSDEDEYPPTQEAMQLLYAASSSPAKKLIHYPAVHEAPWRWYETFSNRVKMPANGGHGTDLFKSHPELPQIIVQWLVTTLIETPGHAPADPLAAAPILTDVAFGDGVQRAADKLIEARKQDPLVQLWPEVSMTEVGENFMRAGDMKSAVAVMKLNLLAYPESADVYENLAEADLGAGQNDLARQDAQKALAILSTPGVPASSWTNTDPYRGEIRKGAQQVLDKLNAAKEFRDCADCPEVVVVPAGHFVMGSSPDEKSWAASHGGSLGAVADEAPQHQVSVPSFALGKYDVTRAQYAAFVRETGYPAGDGCGSGRAIFKWEKDPTLSWEHPGQEQTDRDPVVCVSWHDARAYVAWLSRKTGHAYRLPSEAEWEYATRAGTTTKFYWGDDDAAASVHAWFNGNSGCQNIKGLYCDGGHTHPVGAKPPNAFGLYDMAGNVWQWTEDCYDNSYVGVPADGRANDTPSTDPKAKDSQGNCLRVDRGGSWMYPAWLLRPATRERNPADFRANIMGFRVARTLP